MKKKSRILLVSLLIFSCGRNKYEKELIGKWFEVREVDKFEFRKDSLTAYGSFSKSEWKADKNKILVLLKNDFNDSIKTVFLKYEFIKDTLKIRTNEEIEFYEYNYIRANNFTDFIFKKNKVIIDLEKNEKSEYLPTENKNGIKVFVEKEKGEIKIKTEYSKNLNNLESDIKNLLKDLSPYIINEAEYLRTDKDTDESTIKKWIKFNAYYSLFVDKEISKSKSIL